MDLLDRMLGHDRWTTARFLELSRGLTGEQLDQPFDIGHRTLRATFGHMISAVGFWTAAMAGQPDEMREDDRPLAVLIDEHERSYAAFAALARRIHDEGRLAETFIDWYGWPKTFGGTILNAPCTTSGTAARSCTSCNASASPACPTATPRSGSTRWKSSSRSSSSGVYTCG